MLRLRSCASSMMMVSYAESHGSPWVSASRMPSVMNLIRLRSDTWSLKRTWKPTMSPTCVPSSSATRRATDRASGGEAQLRQLGGLARAGLAGDHHHLVLADQLDDVLAARADRQRFVEPDRRLGRHPGAAFGRGALDIRAQCHQLVLVGPTRKRAPAPQQATEVAAGHRIQLLAQLAQTGVGSGIGSRWAGVVHRTAHDSCWRPANLIARGY